MSAAFFSVKFDHFTRIYPKRIFFELTDLVKSHKVIRGLKYNTSHFIGKCTTKSEMQFNSREVLL